MISEATFSVVKFSNDYETKQALKNNQMHVDVRKLQQLLGFLKARDLCTWKSFHV